MLSHSSAIVNSDTADTTVVAAVSGKRIVVTAVSITKNGAGGETFRFESGVAGAFLTGAFNLVDGIGVVNLPYNPNGWFRTAIGVLLNIQKSSTSDAIGGIVQYTLES